MFLGEELLSGVDATGMYLRQWHPLANEELPGKLLLERSEEPYKESASDVTKVDASSHRHPPSKKRSHPFRPSLALQGCEDKQNGHIRQTRLCQKNLIFPLRQLLDRIAPQIFSEVTAFS